MKSRFWGEDAIQLLRWQRLALTGLCILKMPAQQVVGGARFKYVKGSVKGSVLEL